MIARLALAYRNWQIHRRITQSGLSGRHVDFEGLKIYLYSKETGLPPLFLLHGFLDSCRTFRRLFAPLQERFDIYAFDIPGFGRSHMPAIRELWRLDSMARITGRFMMHLLRDRKARLGENGKAQMLTHSMGGLVALHAFFDLEEYGIQELFSRVHFVAPGMLRFHPDERDAHRRRFYPRSVEEIRALMAELFHEARTDLPEFLLRGILRMWSHAGYEYLAENTIEEEEHIFFEPKRRVKIKPKPFLYWGAEDRIVPLKYGTLVEKTLGCKLVAIEGAGHCPQVEQVERLAALVLANAGVR